MPYWEDDLMNRCKLLLIERDPLLQTLLLEIFGDAGYDVYSAVDDDDAIAITEQVVPDIAIISGGPRGTFAAGWRTAERLRQVHAGLRLIMLSTNESVVEEVGRTERGRLFVAGVRKPFVVDKLLATVAQWHPERRSVEAPAAPTKAVCGA